jgi:hypothetical protein
MNSIGKPSASYWIDSVAGLVGTLVNPVSLAAVLQHLRHKRQTFELPVLVKRAEDLLAGANLDQVSCPKLCHLNASSTEKNDAPNKTFC